MSKVSDISQIETLLLEIDGLPRPKITQNSETPHPTVTTCLENAIINLEQVINAVTLYIIALVCPNSGAVAARGGPGGNYVPLKYACATPVMAG